MNVTILPVIRRPLNQIPSGVRLVSWLFHPTSSCATLMPSRHEGLYMD